MRGHMRQSIDTHLTGTGLQRPKMCYEAGIARALSIPYRGSTHPHTEREREALRELAGGRRCLREGGRADRMSRASSRLSPKKRQWGLESRTSDLLSPSLPLSLLSRGGGSSPRVSLRDAKPAADPMPDLLFSSSSLGAAALSFTSRPGIRI